MFLFHGLYPIPLKSFNIMKFRSICLLLFVVAAVSGNAFSQKNKRMGFYEKAAEEFVATLGAESNFKERGDALKLEILKSLVPLRKRIKTSEGLLNATGIATTGSGAAATGLSQVLTDDASKKLIGFVSSMATTVFGGVQILISKTDGAVDYAKVCKSVLQEWDINEKQDRDAYVKLLAKAEAVHDSFSRFAIYKTDIDAATAPKKVKQKEFLAEV